MLVCAPPHLGAQPSLPTWLSFRAFPTMQQLFTDVKTLNQRGSHSDVLDSMQQLFTDVKTLMQQQFQFKVIVVKTCSLNFLNFFPLDDFEMVLSLTRRFILYHQPLVSVSLDPFSFLCLLMFMNMGFQLLVILRIQNSNIWQVILLLLSSSVTYFFNFRSKICGILI